MSRISLSFSSDQGLPANETSLYQDQFVNHALIDFVSSRLLVLGLDHMGLAKRLKPSNPSSIFFELEDFFSTGLLKDKLKARLPAALGVEPNQIQEIERAFEGGKFASLELFLANFNVILEHAPKIIAEPRYHNIVFPGMSFSGGMVNRNLPLSLGELLEHYQAGDLIESGCCGKLYAYAVNGSMLSGAHVLSCVCPACGQTSTTEDGDFRRHARAILAYRAPFPFFVSPLSVQALIDSLK
jgi:hypothetical protein